MELTMDYLTQLKKLTFNAKYFGLAFTDQYLGSAFWRFDDMFLSIIYLHLQLEDE